MKFKKFKAEMQKVYKQLPADEVFPSDEYLRLIPKEHRKDLLDVAKESVIEYLESKAKIDEEGTCTTDREETQSESIDATLAERGANYGKFTNHAKLSQTLQAAFEQHVRMYGQPEKYTDSMNEAIQLIFHKLARIANGNPTYVDSWTDISGYSTLIVKELNGEPI